MLNRFQLLFDFPIDKLEPLAGYDNKNYRMQTGTDSYILKTYPFSEEIRDLVEAENETLSYLKSRNVTGIPAPIPFSDGHFLKTVDFNGEQLLCRVLTYQAGRFLGETSHTLEMAYSLGEFLAHLDTGLKGFHHYVLAARSWAWDLQHPELSKKYLSEIEEPRIKGVVHYFFQQFEENVIPVLPELRKSIIHNDANDWNLLVSDEKISGIIDFGDLTYAPLINELAVALTYLCFGKESPLEWAAEALRGYHSVLPLLPKELDALYYLIGGRLCISICNAARAAKENPDNEYAQISDAHARKLLLRWLGINSISAKNTFYKACSFETEPMRPIPELVERRHKVISPIFSLSYKKPIHVSRSAFQYMYDAEGNTFLDAYNNIPHVGHSHPKVVEAGMRQMAILNTNTRYYYDLLPEYAEKVLAKFPPKLSKIYFVNSGSAASDLAMRMAYFHTGRDGVMVMEHGYHGHTQKAIDISDYKFNDARGTGQKPNILKVEIPDTYRGKYRQNDGSAGRKYAEEAIHALDNFNRPPAAFISEPIVGCGGQVPLAAGYLQEIYPAVQERGGICISDEVQTGFGRLGDLFWGFEAQKVIPDMVILGKPMGNGHPMGAVVTTDEIAASFEKGPEFFSSFGGNPVSCAIGLSVLEVMEEEGLQENALETGNYYTSLLRNLQKEYPCIGDVRGSGLFLGIEIVKPGTLEPDTELAQLIKNELRNRHILVSTDGPYDSVIKSKPPLCFSKEDALQVVEEIASILGNR